MKSWWTRDIDPIVTVLSDTNEATLADGLVVPGLVNTGCPNTYNYGLWCKNLWMLREWRDNPKYKHVKWFYRGMDDTWLQLENLVWLTKTHDYRQPIVIGERVCEARGFYPDGGPGFLISRGVIDHPDLISGWNASLKLNGGEKEIIDDMIWGLYIKLNKLTFIHSNGISHATLSQDSEVWQYFLHQQGHPWPLHFRPVAYHQQEEHLQFMPHMTRQLSKLNYAHLSNDLYTTPDCQCRTNLHRRCSWAHSNLGPCDWWSPLLYCLGPGPWPHPHKQLERPDGNRVMLHTIGIVDNIDALQKMVDEQISAADFFQALDASEMIDDKWKQLFEDIQKYAVELETSQSNSTTGDQTLSQFLLPIVTNELERKQIIRFCLSHDLSTGMMKSESGRQIVEKTLENDSSIKPEEMLLWLKLKFALRRYLNETEEIEAT